MAYLPLPQRLLAALDQDLTAPAQLYKSGTEWLPVTAAEFLQRIAALTRALADLGIQAGDRVALFAPNRPEWHVVDFALLGLGAINVPIIYFSVRWWNTLHQGATVSLTAAPKMAAIMLTAMLIMTFAAWFYSIAVTLTRVRAIILERERRTSWAGELAGATR